MQDDEIKEDILVQDNKSAITIQKKYLYSTRKGTKHIHVHYFFVVDKLESKDIRMIYYPTEKMLADLSSKLTQGSLFQ